MTVLRLRATDRLRHTDEIDRHAQDVRKVLETPRWRATSGIDLPAERNSKKRWRQDTSARAC